MSNASDLRPVAYVGGAHLRRSSKPRLDSNRRAIRLGEDNNAELEKGWITKGDTIPDLAIKIGLDPSALDSTIARWNADAASGEDTEFGRTLMLKPLSTKGPYYAVELSPSMLNTQGGPRRNEKAEIVKPDGTPIPRLYSAGELGSIYSYLYQGTGNIGECLAFGRIAGREATTLPDWA